MCCLVSLVEEKEDNHEDSGNITLDSIWDSLSSPMSESAKTRKREVMSHRDLLTKNMTTAEYLYYSECTKVSFTRPVKRSKFSEWCKLNTYPINFTTECIDVLGQLTYEFVEDTIRGTLKTLPTAGTAVQPEQITMYITNKLQSM